MLAEEGEFPLDLGPVRRSGGIAKVAQRPDHLGDATGIVTEDLAVLLEPAECHGMVGRGLQMFASMPEVDHLGFGRQGLQEGPVVGGAIGDSVTRMAVKPVSPLPQLGHGDANPLIFRDRTPEGRHYRAADGKVVRTRSDGDPRRRLLRFMPSWAAEARAPCSVGYGAAGRGAGRRWSVDARPPSGGEGLEDGARCEA